MDDSEKKAIKLLQELGYRVSNTGVDKGRYFHKFLMVSIHGLQSFKYQVSSVRNPVLQGSKKHWFVEFDDSKIKWIEDKK